VQSGHDEGGRAATRVGLGKSTSRRSADAGRAAAAGAMGPLGGSRPALVLVFATAGYDQRALLEAVTAVTGRAPLSGCTGEGVITPGGSDEGSHAVCVMAVASEEIAFHTRRIREVGRDPRAAAARLCSELRSCATRARVLLLFPDGLTINCTQLLDAIEEELPYPVTVVGGAAGDALRFERTFQYHDGEVDSDSVSAVLIGGDVSAEIAVSHGSELFGLERTVTRAEGGHVREIDGRPALAALGGYLGEGTGGLNPLDVAYLCVAERLPGGGDPEYGEHVVRVPLALDRRSGTIFFPGGLETGARFQMARRSRGRIQRHALASVRRLVQRRPARRPLLALQFDCAGRGRLLFGERAAGAVVEPVRGALGDEVPSVGFHSYGEIAPLLGRAYYHNYTLVLCALYEGEREGASRSVPEGRARLASSSPPEPLAMLDAQLRALVRTERQLYASQRQVERQLGRIKALNRFVLEASAREAPATPRNILALAAETFFAVSPYEQAVGLLADGSGELRPVAVAARPGREADSARALARRPRGPRVEQLAHLSAPLLIGPSSGDPAVAALCRCLRELFAEEGSPEAQGSPAHLVLPVRRRDGGLAAVLVLRCAASCVTFHDPLPGREDLAFLELARAHVEGALEDALLRKELEELAAELEQRVERRTAELARKDEFLAVLSHELRNPLAPIRNAVYILDRAEPGGPEAACAKAIIARQVDHLSRLVDDLLDVTRISRGKVQLARCRVELTEIVRRAVEDHAPEFVRREVALRLGAEGAPLWIDADPTRISQVMSNLLQNAGKFTEARGHVHVSVGQEGRERAVIRVADDGVGIAPELLPRLFQPFTQADEGLHRPNGGLGLGLALVKGLVGLHGGTVEASSGGVDRGAEFTVRLPLAPEREEEGAARSARAVATARRVLVVEDNRDHAETLRTILALGGHEVVEAYDGPSGVAKAREFRPDVVLCDVGLPGMDGYEVARAIRADRSLASTVLVAVTGYTQPDDQRRSAEAGFDRHLGKPITLEQLEGVVAGSVRR
jgi:two-component system CheB/CheR fusion protein